MRRFRVFLAIVALLVLSAQYAFSAPATNKPLTADLAVAIVRSAYPGISSRMVPSVKPEVALLEKENKAYVAFTVRAEKKFATEAGNDTIDGVKVTFDHMAVFEVVGNTVTTAVEMERNLKDVWVQQIGSSEITKLDLGSMSLPVPTITPPADPKSKDDGLSAEATEPMCLYQDCHYVDGYMSGSWQWQMAEGAACGIVGGGPITCSILVWVTFYVPGHWECYQYYAKCYVE